MTSAWALLTWRGRFLIVTGLGFAAYAMVRGERDALWLALFCIALPLAAIILVRTSRIRLDVDRQIYPAQGPVGSKFKALLTLTRKGPLAGGVMLLEEPVPSVLGNPARFVTNQFSGPLRNEITYALRGRQRGRFHVGPLTMETRDPFGLVRLKRAHHATTEILVTPKVWDLDTTSAGAGEGSVGEARPEQLSAVGDDDVVVREYRHGDDMRRVHWKSSAKLGELMVRREEQALDPSTTILLDSRFIAHGGQGSMGSIEWAVSAAASIALHMIRRGYRVNIVDANGDGLFTQIGHDRLLAEQEVLEYLTDIQLSTNPAIAPLVNAGRLLSDSRVLVAIVGNVQPLDAQLLAGLRTHRAQAMAIVLNTDSFSTERATTWRTGVEARAVFDSTGWATVSADKFTPVREAWRALSIGARR